MGGRGIYWSTRLLSGTHLRLREVSGVPAGLAGGPKGDHAADGGESWGR